MIALAAILLALALGFASGGAARGLEAVRLRFEVPVIVLFVLQAVARGRLVGTSASQWGMSVWVICCAALIGLLIPDWRQPGVWLAATGVGLNLLVVLLNGGMPVQILGGSFTGSAESIARSLGFYQLAGPETFAGAIGDVVPMAVAGSRSLLSSGDILLALGAAILVIDGMSRPGIRVARD